MHRYAIFVAFCVLSQIHAAEESPRIIIVGCGASGIAAATRLLQNGFDDITILEAENRIGGRICTTPFAGYVVDLGAQWVHGEEDNLSYELAWPLGLIEHSVLPGPLLLFDSSGSQMPEAMGNELMRYYLNATETKIPESYFNKSMADYYKPRIEEFLNSQTELTVGQRKSLTDMVNLFHMAMYAGPSWSDVSVHPEHRCNGDQGMNWKEKGYSTILDILMKKYPDATQELPLLNKTLLNTEVTKINYTAAGDIRVTTANGDEYSAEHVIVTPSVAVLKADYKTLFDPPLPEAKINAIKHMELGAVVKIFLSYPEPWWTRGNESSPVFNFYWREEDKNEYANDPEKSWMLGLIYLFPVENKPRLLCAWVTGIRVREIENIPDERVFDQTKEFLRRFLGKTQNLTEPTEMIRSKWLGNKNFRGTWSYRSLETERSGAKAEDLSLPVTRDGNPLLLFAGEATHSKYPSTVHGAIGSGWREADRLIKLYADRKSSTT